VTNGGSVRRGSHLAYEWERDNVECLKASRTVLVLSPDQHYRSRMPQFAGYSKRHHVLRRDVMLAALASSLPIGFADSAAASPLNPEHTIIRPLSPTYRPPPERGADGASADYADGTVDVVTGGADVAAAVDAGGVVGGATCEAGGAAAVDARGAELCGAIDCEPPLRAQEDKLPISNTTTDRPPASS
jgi:hypothetical protein